MRERLHKRGKSWDEFIELLGNMKLDDLERKAREGKEKGGNAPLQPPRALIPKEAPKERKRKRGEPLK